MHWRKFLFPFSALYGAITALRNWAFDRGLLKTTAFDIPIIALGNLSTGGTGKTPHTEYILSLFPDRKWVVLSRGYGRKSKGFLWVEAEGKVEDFGDEPLQIKNKFLSIPVAVCEDRVIAIPQILAEFPDTEAILLDDAYQHRYIKAKGYILLSTESEPYFKDSILPTGNLRESINGSRRAKAIIITKCTAFPELLAEQKWKQDLKLASNQSLFFSKFIKSDAYNLGDEKVDAASFKESEVFVFSAIAGGSAWSENYLPLFKSKLGELIYRDHYQFSIHDINLLKSKLKPNCVVLTTEKDAMRLKKFKKELEGIRILYFPIYVEMNDEQGFRELISSLID